MKLIVKLITFIIITTYIEAEEDVKVEFEFEKKYKLCSQIGIEDNALLNECGYCTEGDTGLESSYGFDCNHVCDGDSYFDCNNVCDGNSYIDPCTGICINPSKTEITYDERDCRGLCSSSHNNSNQYLLNECGQCLLKDTPKYLNNCSLKCGHNEYEKSYICDQCLDSDDSQTLSEVLNQCGYCRSNDTSGCSCDKNPLLCGCSHSNNCYYLSDISPKTLPKNKELQIRAFGYFNGPIIIFECILSHQLNGTLFLFPARVENKTIIECVVNLTEVGQYVFGLKSIGSDVSLNIFENSNLILVYDSDSVIYSNMSPTHILTTSHANSVTLTFNTSNEENQAIHRIHLKCIIIYNDLREFVVSGDNWFSCTIPASQSHLHSQSIKVIPTFDGIHSLANESNFLLTIIAPSPQILQNKSFISEDGLNIVIFFEPAIDLTNIEEKCDILLTNLTLSQLEKYGLVYCKWLTKVQLLISLSSPIDEEFIEISFKESTLKEWAQEIALYNTQTLKVIVNKLNSETNHWSYKSRIVLIGPILMPLCGIFTINGYFSSSKGSKGVKFKWSISSLPPRNDLISDELLKQIDSNNKSSLLLEANNFSLEPYSYRFILRAQLTDGRVIEASHQIFKYNYELPIVTIFPTTLLASRPLTLDQSLMLYTEVSIPQCIANPQPIIYEWKINNPKVKFNFSNKNSPNYQINEFTLPDERIKFEVHVFMGNHTTHASIASLTLDPFIPDIINDISMLSIGQESGEFKLNSNILRVQRNKNIAYQWSCHYSDSQQPCVLYSNHSKLLISKEVQNMPHLTLDSDMLQISQHRFGLHILYANDTNKGLSTTFTTVNVYEGNSPQVFMASVYISQNHKLLSETISPNVISVPSHTRLVIKGIVKNLESNDSFEWLLSESVFQLQWNFQYLNDEIQTELILHEDHIFPFGSYNLTLKACNLKRFCSEVHKTLIASQVVSNCKVIIEQLVPMKMTTVTIEKCNIPPNLSPLTYQLFLIINENQTFIPISRPQFSSIINYFAPQLNLNSTELGAEVCDNYNYCQVFKATNDAVIEIVLNQNRIEFIDNIINSSLRYSLIEDPISALVLLINSLSNRSFYETKLIHSLIVKHLKMISYKHIRKKGDLSVIYYVFGEIIKQTNDYYLKNDVIVVLQNFIQTTLILPDLRTLDLLYTNLLNFYKFENKFFTQLNETYGYYTTINQTDQYLSKIRLIFLHILELTAKQIPIGRYIKLGDKIDFAKAVTLITHQKSFFEIKLETKLNHWKNVTTIVKFNEKRISKYLNKLSKNTTHNSIVYAITIFPDESPFNFNDKVHKLSPIVDITIHSPMNGNKYDLNAEKYDYIAIMKVTITGNKTYGGSDFTTKCHYFDENKDKWDTEGIEELGISGSNGGCFMYHLSAIVILRVTLHYSTDYIFGVIVAVMMGVLIFGIMTVFFVQKKNENSPRVVPQTYSY